MIYIDLEALSHNYYTIRHFAPSSKILCMVKANAYGHGLIPIAKKLEEIQVDGLGAACLSEAIQLRKEGITSKIVLMRGVQHLEELALAEQYQLELVIHHREQANLLLSQRPTVSLWLKINTGMNRLGLEPQEVKEIYTKLTQHGFHHISLMTHFAASESQSRAETLAQAKLFEQITAQYPGEKSLCNSAGILHYPEYHKDWVRPGLILYGVSPIENKLAQVHDLKPVMTFESSVISMYTAKKGDKVGYKGLYTCEENIPIGIVGAGYGDGYSSLIKTGTPVLVNGQEATLIGRVSMDTLAVDLRNVSSVKLQDKAILWGKGLPIEKVAQHNSLLPYELLCHVRER